MNVPSSRSPQHRAGSRPWSADALAQWAHDKSLGANFPLVAAALIFAGVLGMSEVLSRFRSAELISERKAATLAFASELRARADRELNSVLYLANGIVGYLIVRRDRIDADEIQKILAAVHADSRHVRNFAIAVGYRLSFVYPQAGNEALIGRDYRALPEQWPAVRRASEYRMRILTGPVNLVQGGSALIYRTPIFVDDAYWGLLSSVIDMQSFQKAVFSGVDDARYEFAVRGIDNGASASKMLWGRPELFADPQALRIEAPVPDGTWVYAVRDKRTDSLLSAWVIRGIGALLGALTALCVGLVLHQRRALAEHAGIDALTALPNRRLFDDRLDQAFRRHARAATEEIAVLFIDLDGFKPINDRYGHKAGDVVLHGVAQRLRAEVRIGDTVARWAGDEFIILVEDADQALIEQLTARLRARMRQPHAIGGDMLSVDASIGIAIYPRDAGSAAELLELADHRMCQDKAGKYERAP